MISPNSNLHPVSGTGSRQRVGMRYQRLPETMSDYPPDEQPDDALDRGHLRLRIRAAFQGIPLGEGIRLNQAQGAPCRDPLSCLATRAYPAPAIPREQTCSAFPHRQTPGVEILVEDNAGGRIDAFLAARLAELSRSRIQTLIREQHIQLNGHPAKPRDAVKSGDRITIVVPEAVPLDNAPQDIALDILFEDDDLVVLNKASGMVVHPAPGNHDGTLVNALLHHCKGKLSGIGGVERPGIVHRLDKDTSGCLVVAKSDVAHQSLVTQFSERSTMEKLYLAVTQGVPKQAKDTIFTHIGRHPVNRQKMAVVNPPGGKAAITDYEILATDAASITALVLCHLHTGRTHQIRVHMHHKGTPLVGDPIYGKPSRTSGETGRLMLHAWRLSFEHPVTRRCHRFEAPVPPEFAPWVAMAGGLGSGGE